MNRFLHWRRAALVAVVALASISAASAQSGPGAEFVVNTTLPGNQLYPDLDMRSDGSFVIVWQSDSIDVDTRLYNASGAAATGELDVNDGGTLAASTTAVVAKEDGGFVAVWQGGVFPDLAIRAQRFSSTGAKLGGPITVSTASILGAGANPVVGADQNNDFVVAWTTPYAGNVDVRARRFNSDGTPKDAADFVVNTTSSYEYYADIAVEPDGDFVVAWQTGPGVSFPTPAGYDYNYDVRARRFNADGTPKDANDFLVNTTTAENQAYVGVASKPDGEFVVVWRHGFDFETGTAIRGQRFNSDGTPNGAEFQVTPAGPAYNGQPSVDMDSAGNFVVAWNSYNNDGVSDLADIKGQCYSATGAAAGPIFVANTWTDYQQYSPSVGITTEGFAVSWMSVRDGGPGAPTANVNRNIAGRRFEAGARFAGASVDGLDAGDQIGIFVQNIGPVMNTFSADVFGSCNAGGAIQQVDFKVGDSITEFGADQGNGRWTADFDMALMPAGNSTVEIKGRTEGGESFTDTANLQVIAFPDWIGVVQTLTNDIVIEYQEPPAVTEERYHIGWNYPTNFLWSDVVPTNIPLFGASGNEANVAIDADAYFHLDGSSVFNASGGVDVTLYDHPVRIGAGGEVAFDSNFLFERAQFYGYLGVPPIQLPQKSLSHTFPPTTPLGPIKVTLDLSGAVDAGVLLVLNTDDSFSITGGILRAMLNAQVSATATAEVFVGLAKLAVTASPDVGLQLYIDYTSQDGIDPRFVGSIEIPVKIVGTLAGGSLTAFDEVLGPYIWDTGRAVTRAGSRSAPVTPDFVAHGALAVDDAGRRMAVFTADSDPSAAIDPDVFFRFDDGLGGGFSAGAAVASEASSFETDPAVTFLPGGDALAVWSAADASVSSLSGSLARQDLRYSVWNGAAWSSPAFLIDDLEADGLVDLGYDVGGGVAIAAWVRDVDSDQDVRTRTEWNVFAATFDPLTSSWSPAANLSGVDTAADYAPATAGNVVIWAKDLDGELVTEEPQIELGTNVDSQNTDGSLRFATLAAGSWSSPAIVTGSDLAGSVVATDLALISGTDDVVAVWIVRDRGIDPGTSEHSVMLSVYDESAGAWSSTPLVVTTGNRLLEQVAVAVDPAAPTVAEVFWRSTAAEGRGELESASISLASLRNLRGPSTSQRLTHNGEVEWGLTSVIDPSGDPLLLFRQDDFEEGSDHTGDGWAHNLNVCRWDRDAAMLDDVSGFVSLSPALPVHSVVRLNVDAIVSTPGDYRVQADLRDGDGLLVHRASQTLLGLSSGTHGFQVDFPGQFVSQHGVDGPFVVSNVVLLDEGNCGFALDRLPTDLLGPAAAVEDFVAGLLNFDADLYTEDSPMGLLTLDDPAADLDASAVDVVTVQLLSSAEPDGIDVVLAETGLSTGTFEVVVLFDLDSSVPGSAQLRVRRADGVVALYQQPLTGHQWFDGAAWQAENPVPVELKGFTID